MDSRGEEELVMALVRRRDALSTLLRDGVCTPRQLEAELGLSRSSVHRILSQLVDHHVVERTVDGYVLTAMGTFLADEVEAFDDRVGVLGNLRPVVEGLRSLPVTFDPSDFADATVSRATPEDPYRPVTRYLELFETTSTVRSIQVTPHAPPETVATFAERLEDGLETTILWNEGVLEEWVDAHPSFLERTIADDRQTMLVVDDAPINFILHDGRVCIPGYDSTTGTPSILVDSANPDAVAWGEAVFEAYRAKARPIESVLDG